MKIIDKTVSNLPDLIKYIEKQEVSNDYQLFYRGEKKCYGNTSLVPSIYRDPGYIHKEDIIYRESQRFNDREFIADRTALLID